MKRFWIAVFLAGLAGGGFLTGAWVTWHASGTGKPAAARSVLYYICPMHPQFRSERAGDCPSCGMRLEPVYADDSTALSGSALPPGTLRISPERQQTVGISIGQVEVQSLTRTIRTVGRVVVDENRVYRVLAASNGIVRTLDNNSAGSLVRKNERLLTYYSRDLVGAQQAYFFALQTYDRFKTSGASDEQMASTATQVRGAIDSLLNLGMGEIQIAELAATRKATTEIDVRAPVTGYVMARGTFSLERFERGAELYRILDLARVWILADMFENEGYRFRPGTPVRVSSRFGGARGVEARVSNVLPQVDAATRTLRLRLEADNADYSLRPDMFVDVDLPVALPKALTVPADAVVDSGVRKTVFVDRGNGYFEPRRVETGWRFDDRVEVVKGLMPGERIVLSGNFLLDSESRMKAAAMGIFAPAQDPVCAMEVDEGKARSAGRVAVHRGETYFFCSDLCKKQFDASPAKYVTESHASGPSAGPVLREALPFSGRSGPDLPGLETVPGGTLPPQAPRPTKYRPLGTPGDLPPPPRPELQEQKPVGQEPQPAVSAAAPATETPVHADPACGITVTEAGAKDAGLVSEYQGKTFYFSSRDCKKAFDLNPALYVRQEDAGAQKAAQPGPPPAGAVGPTAPPQPPASKPSLGVGAMPGRRVRPRVPPSPPAGSGGTQATAPAAAKPDMRQAPAPAGQKDPVCGMEVDAKEAAAAKLKSDYKGKTYYFCSDDCKKKFDKEPGRWVKEL